VSDTRFKRPESVLIVVFNRAGEVLLLKRRDHANFWQSVTGSLHWDESPFEAANRELREETGLEAGGALKDEQRTFTFEILAQWRYRYASGVTWNLEHVFSLAVDGRPAIHIDAGEHSEYRWLRRDRAAETVWSWTNREAVLDLVPDPGTCH
jgi:dATP pyrophosphohydrolase